MHFSWWMYYIVKFEIIESHKDGLIYTSIKLTYENNTVIVDNVIIDIGAFDTIITTNFYFLFDRRKIFQMI